MDPDYVSDDSMSNSFELDGSDLSDAPSEETVILLTPPSSPEPGESDGYQVEAPASRRSTHSADRPAPVSGTTSVYFGGYSYARYHFTDEASHYRCSAYRRTKCKAKLYVSSMGAVETGNHMSNCVPDFRRAPVGPPPAILDRTDQMLLTTDAICVRDVTLTPLEVWCMVRDQFDGDDNDIVRGATKKQVLGRLYRTRAKLFGRDIFGRLERKPLCDVKSSPGLKFFQFHVTYYEDEVRHRLIGWLIGWAYPQLMDWMKQRKIFVDATYRCVPAPFYQLAIVMIYDSISELYLPVWYILTTGKTAQMYKRQFHNIYVALKQKLVPAHFVCDFEFAMIIAALGQFPEVTIVGYPTEDFHTTLTSSIELLCALQVEYRVAAINCDFGSVWLAPNARGVEENMCVIQARTGYAKVKTPEQSCDGACVDVEKMLQQE
ncbi:hypothetical protein PR001_g4795 [Phytophthora rubi]|uniref:FLYWCH-type domain-containing protein n=1 Tax=Phytophthora rubi TaxID=129364 RepID=A0A6A3NXI6_9STRA|nr:hypothetical protein PR001_g4795 [Phytophthora rubi]